MNTFCQIVLIVVNTFAFFVLITINTFRLQRYGLFPNSASFRAKKYFTTKFLCQILTKTRENLVPLSKQLIHSYLFLYHIVVVVVCNTVCCDHDKMKSAFVFRKLSVCVKFVLQVLSVIIVYGEGVYGMLHLADVRKAVGPLYD